MADFVIPVVLENLIKLLTDETDLLAGVKDQVKLLQGDLRIMNAFLKNSEGKRSDHPLVIEVVDQIRDIALEARNVIDTYVTSVIKQRRRSLLGKTFHCIVHAKILHDVGDKTASLKKEITNIYENREAFDIGEAESCYVDAEAEQSLQTRRRNVEEDDVVGFDNDATTLVKQLTDQHDLKLDVISIVGMGGLGKTTLARKIYNNSLVKSHFQCHAWVYGSQDCKTQEWLLGIIRCIMQVTVEMYEMTNEALKEILHEQLQGKRYLVVMDDIWRTQIWEELGSAFPNDLNGSRILITSRIKEVALHASATTPPFFLPFLGEKESWELFHKKVFRGGQCPSNLEPIERTLAEKCKGLPLSIVVLGGLLATKEKSLRTWSRFIDNVNWYLTEDKTRCLDILALSYNHLPRHLKLCFLYVGGFPEDFKIPARQLINLWSAEGFIEQNGNRDVDDVAEDYLEQLIDRSLIQVASNRSDGGVKTCRIHDLLRDFCINESKQEKFIEVHSNANLSSMMMSKPHRLSITNCKMNRYISSNTCDPSCARSLLIFSYEGRLYEGHWRWVYKGFKFIRVLHIEFVDDPVILPGEIGKLFFLRCFRICGVGKVEAIPASICTLPYLETIEICRYVSNLLPKDIWMMKQLRNLNLRHGMRLPDPPRKMNEPLWNLQVLSNLQVDGKTECLISKFPNLKKLCLEFDVETEANVVIQVSTKLQYLRHLQTLKIRHFILGSNSDQIHLQYFPERLAKISFEYSNLESCHYKILGQLPNLRVLKVRYTKSHSPCHLKFIAGEFPQLEFFELKGQKTETWEVERGAVPNLGRLVIRNCSKLKDLPNQLWDLPCLQLVKVLRVSEDLRNKLKNLSINNQVKLLID